MSTVPGLFSGGSTGAADGTLISSNGSAPYTFAALNTVYTLHVRAIDSVTHLDPWQDSTTPAVLTPPTGVSLSANGTTGWTTGALTLSALTGVNQPVYAKQTARETSSAAVIAVGSLAFADRSAVLYTSGFESDTTNARPSPWVYNPTYTDGLKVQTGGLNSSSKSLQAPYNNAGAAYVLAAVPFTPVANVTVQFTTKTLAVNQTLTKGYGEFRVMSGFVSGSSQGNAIAGVQLYNPDGDGLAICALTGGTLTRTRLVNVSNNTEYTITIEVSQATGKFRIKVGSTWYDNGGSWYSLTYTQTGWTTVNAFCVDNTACDISGSTVYVDDVTVTRV